MNIAEYQAKNMPCECVDSMCLSVCHKGDELHDFRAYATRVLYRLDMSDSMGTPMCDDCASDARRSGVFGE